MTQSEDDKWKPKRKAETTQKFYFKEVFNRKHKSSAHLFSPFALS